MSIETKLLKFCEEDRKMSIKYVKSKKIWIFGRLKAEIEMRKLKNNGGRILKVKKGLDKKLGPPDFGALCCCTGCTAS